VLGVGGIPKSFGRYLSRKWWENQLVLREWGEEWVKQTGRWTNEKRAWGGGAVMLFKLERDEIYIIPLHKEPLLSIPGAEGKKKREN